jgi:5-aminopentanamidase
MNTADCIAVWQSTSPQGDEAAAFAALDCALGAAAAMGAFVLVAPELYLPGYNQPDLPAKAQASDGQWAQRLSAMARKHGTALALGYAERDGAGLANSAMVFDGTGAQIAQYRKVQLYGPREKHLFQPGQAHVTFDLAGHHCALMICYDVEFAPHIATLAAQGVDVILVPTANMAPFTHVAMATVPAMAANYGVTIAYANYCGSEGDLDYVGLSLVAGPHGEVLAQAGTGPTILVVDLPARDPARLTTQAADLRVISG